MALPTAMADSLCPEALRGAIVTPPPGPRSRDLAARLARAEAPAAHALGASDGDIPPVWERALGAHVWDADGNRYLDLVSGFGVASVGHQHPRVVAAAQAQSARLAHGFGDVHPHVPRIELAERLAALAPFDDARVVFAQSGAEAVELALKTALLATGKPGVLAFTAGYHGMSWGTLEVSGFERFRRPFEVRGEGAMRPRARFAPYGRCARCDLGLSYPGCQLQCVHETERILAAAEKKFGGVGAILVEPMLGRGGDHVPPPEWLPAIEVMARRAGALFVVDEVYTGLGRTGAMWASVDAGATPDVLVCGKALGGGWPIAAVLAPARVMDAWRAAAPESGEAPHAQTFYAHPVACAAALATLEVLRDEALVERAASLGAKLHEGLAQLAAIYPEVAREVRGKGLAAGLVLDSPARVHTVTRALLENGVIALPGGYEGDVLSFSPPFTLADEQLAWALAVLDHALHDASAPTPSAGTAP
jgi:4-aminobutyrate aminotransferase-like enzyme